MGPGRFELPTSRLSGVRSNQLSYEPHKNGYFLTIESDKFKRKLQKKLKTENNKTWIEQSQPQKPAGYNDLLNKEQ